MRKVRFYFNDGEYVEYEDDESYELRVIDGVLHWSNGYGQLLFLADWSNIEYVEAIDQTPDDDEPVDNVIPFHCDRHSIYGKGA